MKTLLYRCEASVPLGTGHALRGLALGQEWLARGGRFLMASHETVPALRERLETAGGEWAGLHAAAGTRDDADEVNALAGRHDAAWIAVDGPVFGADWEAGIATRLLRIDDNGLERGFVAPVLLNQNLGAGFADYPRRPADCRLLLGPRYALLRPEFRAAAGAPAEATILVTLGGTDPAQATERVLAALSEARLDGARVDFVLGAANPRREELVRAIAAAGARCSALVNPPDFARRLAAAALVVTAGGTTVYEAAALGRAMLVVVTAENQRRSSSALAQAGAAVCAGWHAELAPEALGGLIADLWGDPARRAALAQRAAQLVDGRGAARVVDVLREGLA